MVAVSCLVAVYPEVSAKLYFSRGEYQAASGIFVKNYIDQSQEFALCAVVLVYPVMALWHAGTVLGLVTAVSIPYLMITRHEIRPDSAFGGWLMPVVPPMVSAATGALLVPYAPAGQTRLTLLVACYAMFGVSLFATLVLLPQIWSKLVTHGPGPARAVPTLWIVLGPLGQSVTAANALGNVAGDALPAPYAHAASALGVFYGLPTLGFGLLWMAIAGAVTLRTVRDGMPFALTWWGFTFPVGTMATGATALAAHTGSDALTDLAIALYVLLVTAWAIVATRTFRHALTPAAIS